MKPSKIQKFITIKVTDEIHKDVKRRSVDHGLTVTSWVLQAIIEKIEREDIYE